MVAAAVWSRRTAYKPNGEASRQHEEPSERTEQRECEGGPAQSFRGALDTGDEGTCRQSQLRRFLGGRNAVCTER